MIVYDMKVEVVVFEVWFYDEINVGVDWFDFMCLDIGDLVQVCVVQGMLGLLKFDQLMLEVFRCMINIEFWRFIW